MNNVLDKFISDLQTELNKLPQNIKDETISFYIDLINDGKDSSSSDEEIIEKLGDPKKIALEVIAEYEITKLEEKPKLATMYKFLKSMINLFKVVEEKSVPVMLGVIPLTVSVFFMIISIGCQIASICSIALMSYGSYSIAPNFIVEKIGVVGGGLFMLAIFSLIGIMFWKLSAWIMRTTIIKINEALEQSENYNLIKDRRIPKLEIKNAKLKRRILIVVACIGLVLVLCTGVFIDYFRIWNSMEDKNITLVEQEFNTYDISQIRFDLMNTSLIIREYQGKTIIVSYEQPDYYDYELKIENNNLIFNESSNNRLCFMNFTARHEGTANLIISVPKGYEFESIKVGTIGSNIDCEKVSDYILINADTSFVKLKTSADARINVETNRGVIDINNETVDNINYTINGIGEISVTTKSGNIEIEESK